MIEPKANGIVRHLTEQEAVIARKWHGRMVAAEQALKAAQMQHTLVRDACTDLPAAFGHEGCTVDAEAGVIRERSGKD